MISTNRISLTGALLGLLFIVTSCHPQMSDDLPTSPTISGTPGPVKTGWLTDFAQAMDAARRENKTVLLDFTGSDWCGWCITLRREVFNTVEFQNYAATNLVLLEADFPQGIPQSEALKKQNQELLRQCGIEGFPTIIVLNSTGKILGRTGYLPGGPTPFITQINAIIGK